MVPVGQALAQAAAAPRRRPPGTRATNRGYEAIEAKHPKIAEKKSAALQIGTLGGGNHFIELCLDEADRVWVMLHSGSRNIGNRIGKYFIAKAKEEIEAAGFKLAGPRPRLARRRLGRLQRLRRSGRLGARLRALQPRRDDGARCSKVLREHLARSSTTIEVAVNCHHNYVERESTSARRVWLTRKGAVRAGKGELGIIPGSMGARRSSCGAKAIADSFESCSHGAGRAMSRTAAKERFTLEEHIAATAHVECRKDTGVIDETPMAYKDIDAVMAAQSDLVEVVHTLAPDRLREG